MSKGKAVPNIFRVFIFNLQSFSMSSAYGDVSDPHIWHREFFDLFAHRPRKSKQYHLILNPFEGDKRLQINRPGQGLWMEMCKRFPTPIGWVPCHPAVKVTRHWLRSNCARSLNSICSRIFRVWLPYRQWRRSRSLATCEPSALAHVLVPWPSLPNLLWLSIINGDRIDMYCNWFLSRYH